jgi:hypothetical protein
MPLSLVICSSQCPANPLVPHHPDTRTPRPTRIWIYAVAETAAFVTRL